MIRPAFHLAILKQQRYNPKLHFSIGL
jgi:hypothetical protein